MRNDNATAYEYYKLLVSLREKELQLNYFSLALVISIILNCYAYFQNKNVLFSWLIPFVSDTDLSLSNSLISLVLWLFVLCILYLGVIRAGGFSLSVIDKVYFPNNEFRQ